MSKIFILGLDLALAMTALMLRMLRLLRIYCQFIRTTIKNMCYLTQNVNFWYIV